MACGASLWHLAAMEPVVSLEASLPAELRLPSTRITPIGAGLSGAGVHRVEAAGRTFVLKLSGQDVPLADWQRRVDIQKLAAKAGLAPAVVHVDEPTRAVVSAFVVDRSIFAHYGDPRTREAALAQFGQTIRRVHDLPMPPHASFRDPRELLASIAAEARAASFAQPRFVEDAIGRMLGDDGPVCERPIVLSHNDVNPTNLVHDGERLLLLDWETAGPNEPFYDLAAISVFLRMDSATSEKLLAAYDGVPACNLPARFGYNRRLLATLCGSIFLRVARQSGHAGATGEEALEGTPSLGDLYQRMRSGSLSVATAEGQWWFGLALLKESFVL
jgi:aminoglycoside phosphotransferase (APT) family kinase protein